jgi:hemerythrin
MSFMAWRPEFSVGVASLDAQHKRLIEIINELHDAMMQGAAPATLKQVLGHLADYTRTHFSSEENWMMQHGYGGLAAHRREHEELLRQVSGYQQAVAAGKLTVSLQLMNFLKGWLKGHILESDMQYAVAAGVAPAGARGGVPAR